MRTNTLNAAYRFGLLLLLFCCFGGGIKAQQFPISDNIIFKPHLMNPAYAGTRTMNKFFVSHQQRQISYTGWQSISQFFSYSSPPLGRSQQFGWGAFVMNDLEHTERRLNLSAAVAAQVLKRDNMHLSLGINGGFINWGSNYDSVNVYTRNDVLLASASSFTELDAGLGLDFLYTTPQLSGAFTAYATQLPGSFVSRNIAGLFLLPHLLSGGRIQYSPFPDFYAGPMFFYRNTVFQRDTTLHAGQVDIGARFDFVRQGLWLGAAYRFDNLSEGNSPGAAITGAFGLRLAKADTAYVTDGIAYYIDLTMSGSYPINDRALFGPSFELGLNISLERRRYEVIKYDTLGGITGSFWKNNGLMNMHKEQKLTANSPSGLTAFTTVDDRTVLLDYSFDDNMYMYVGDKPTPYQDTLLEAIGQEWVGVDAFFENMVYEVIDEGLHPDTSGGVHPDSLEPLKDLVSLQLITRLKADQTAADFGAEGTKYNGELGDGDVLYVHMMYDYRDTTIRVEKDSLITNLELAALKLHSMRKKLEYELKKYYGDQMYFRWEGEKMTDDMVGRKIVEIKTPMIIPNNPNQKPFAENIMEIKFSRFAEKRTLGQIEGITDTDGKKRKKRKRKKKNDDQRDPIPE